MGLTLTSAAVERFRMVTERLLSPLDYADLTSWARAVLHTVCSLQQADRAELILPLNGSVRMWTEGIPPETLKIASEFIGDLEPGRFRMKDPVLDRALHLRNSSNMRIWSYASMERLAGAHLPQCTFHQEFMVPAGIAHCYGIRVPLPLGDAHLATGFSRPADDQLGPEAGEELLSLVLPAFCSAVSAVRHIYHARSLLPHAIDGLGLAIALFDVHGHEVHRTPDLCAMLADNLDAPLIVATMRTVVMRALAFRGFGAQRSDHDALSKSDYQEIAGSKAPYKLRAVFLPSCPDAPAPAMLVEVRRSISVMPTVRECNALGLTGREAEVALLLAHGASNAEIAVALRISPHTARKHTEHIFEKLGIHTRKAFLLVLASGARKTPTAGHRPAVGIHGDHGPAGVRPTLRSESGA